MRLVQKNEGQIVPRKSRIVYFKFDLDKNSKYSDSFFDRRETTIKRRVRAMTGPIVLFNSKLQVQIGS